MNARHSFPVNAADWSPSWPIRWEQNRDTLRWKACLLSIAAEARTKDDDVFAAAYDAATATDPDERAGYIAELEQLFADADEWERAATGRDECAGWRGSSYASTWGMTE